ncbi:hypothetical protein ANASTE_01580 [Anaerofustis stercorihominis DSM 17244]|uniref:Uncharacterized protein n=1 Tax=Anaerofustis stercorihominis DSM 17244 TaxID=445971 RepID=B1CC80_9FIRM|nr:hypothetical protein [Anaerofustis stercorihominis]EDS71877.1 hypothetical protein ANASTE_01580 [Anaerofustis stercorihominis DSM 17244]
MDYINKKRAVSPPQQNHSTRLNKGITPLEMIINKLLKIIKENSSLIYMFLMLLSSLRIVEVIRLMCKLILIIGGTL